MSQALSKLQIGHEMQFKGPRGRFQYVPNSKRHIGEHCVSRLSLHLPDHLCLFAATLARVLCFEYLHLPLTGQGQISTCRLMSHIQKAVTSWVYTAFKIFWACFLAWTICTNLLINDKLCGELASSLAMRREVLIMPHSFG